MKKKIAISLLGTTLDKRYGQKRWERWRPNIALCQYDDLIIDRLELLFSKDFQSLADLIKQDIKQTSPETEVVFHHIEQQDPWDFEEVYATLHDFSKSYTFNPEKEDYLVHITTGTHVAQICLFLLTEARYLPAQLIQTSPPNKENPLPGTYSTIDLDLSQYDLIAQRFATEQQEGAHFLKSGIATKNPAFNKLIDQIEYVAMHSTAPVLLTGPTGSGKTQLARKVYELKKQRSQISGEFVEVNCATLQGDGAMSALFGHCKGAFTGALSARTGLLLRANQGMLFLDEIGELGLDEQAMLLRAIEEHRFLPVGSDKEKTSQFQLIAGTNRDLIESVKSGHFREDLLARIDLWTFQLPGIKERKQDLAPNIQYELEQYSRQHQHQLSFNKQAYATYLTFSLSEQAIWKANFRDLSASITRMGTLSIGGRIKMAEVNDEISRLLQRWSNHSITPSSKSCLTTHLPQDQIDTLDYIERVQLEAVLEVCMTAKNISSASRQLFNISRTLKKTNNDADRLRKYLAKYSLSWQNIHPS